MPPMLIVRVYVGDHSDLNKKLEKLFHLIA